MNAQLIHDPLRQYVGGSRGVGLCYPQEMANRLCAASSHPLVLDIGTGVAEIALWLREKNISVIGIDINPHCITTARNKCHERGFKLFEAESFLDAIHEASYSAEAQVGFYHMDLATTSVSSACQVFDGVVMHRLMSMLISAASRQNILRSAATLVKPAGYLSWLDFHIMDPSQSLYDNYQEQYRRSSVILNKLVEKNFLTLPSIHQSVRHLLILHTKEGVPVNLLELNDLDEAVRLISHGDITISFIAAHTALDFSKNEVTDLGLDIVHEQTTIIHSRSGKEVPLLGFLAKKHL